PAISPGGGTRRRMESAVTLFPHPDSPTIPSTCFSKISKLTESTAREIPASVRKYVFKSLTSRRAEFIDLHCRISWYEDASSPRNDVLPAPTESALDPGSSRGLTLSRGEPCAPRASVKVSILIAG